MNARKPISNETPVDIATSAVVASGRFERADKDWDKLPKADQTWTNWKPLYLEAHERLRAKEAAQGGANSFRGARANIYAADADAAGGPEPEEAATTLAKLEACMNNLACAAHANTATLFELVKNNRAPTAANAQLSTEVRALGMVNRHTHRLLREANKKVGLPDPASLEEMEEAPPKRTANRQRRKQQCGGKAEDA